MKQKIHPKYVDAVVTCVCGAEIKTRSTLDTIKVEICSQCHPFFTGRQKLVDTAGRIDRFRRKYAGKKTAAGATGTAAATGAASAPTGEAAATDSPAAEAPSES